MAIRAQLIHLIHLMRPDYDSSAVTSSYKNPSDGEGKMILLNTTDIVKDPYKLSDNAALSDVFSI